MENGTPLIRLAGVQKVFYTDEMETHALADIHLEIRDGEQQLLAEGTGSNLLSHPLEVVLWIRDDLKAKGLRLEEGDLLSLGTVTKPLPVEPGTRIEAYYRGLDPSGPAKVSVSFR